MAKRSNPPANRRLGVAAKQVLFAIASFPESVSITKAQILRKIPYPSETGVPQTINRLRRSGHVARTNGAGPGTIGTYRLTPTGKKTLQQLKEGAS
ncbi:MAG: hypothetical protein Q8S00_32480 [Deltaproteobacteria bacterium]|nr:hypothetical protein [Deltaproteobacteria bacterium]